MDEKTTLDTLYIVKKTDDLVALEIVIGDQGQTSLMTVDIGDTIINDKDRKKVKDYPGSLKKVTLGTNNELNGKKLGIIATITDTSRETDMTSLDIRLSGGFAARKYFLSKKVDEQGQSADYICIIEFFSPGA